jgi:hypothetical protein
MYVMAKRPFDLVDIMLAEIEDAIMDGMGVTRQQPFAHWISWLLYRLEAQRYVGMLESSKFVFPTYRPPMPRDRRRGLRGLRRAEETLQARAAAEAVSYGPPWAHYLSGYQNRLLGGPLGLPDLRCTIPDGVKHKDYRGEVLGYEAVHVPHCMEDS